MRNRVERRRRKEDWKKSRDDHMIKGSPFYGATLSLYFTTHSLFWWS